VPARVLVCPWCAGSRRTAVHAAAPFAAHRRRAARSAAADFLRRNAGSPASD
jgi:membrane protein required for beta-lactamase induction